jgi:hypothetical protein
MRTIDKLEDLTPDPANANEGTLRGEQLLEKSISDFGAGRAIVVDKNGIVIGGNKTLQMAVEAGLGVRVVQSDGTKLVVVRRSDLDLETDQKARLLAYFDNRTAELGLKWKPEQLEADLAAGIELGGMFTEAERRSLLAQLIQAEQQVALLRSNIEFETTAQVEQWQRAVTAISAYPGSTFPDKLELWLADQMTALHEVTGAEPTQVIVDDPQEVQSAD